MAGELLAGRRALVTGAAGGIGSAVAAAFRSHGAEVVGADLAGRPGAAATPDRPTAAGALWACDVTDERAVGELFSGPPFDDVVHAAGIVEVGAIAETSPDAFRRVIDVNLVGAFLVAAAAARGAAPGSTITLIASQGARRGGARWGAYCASKFGMVGLAQSLAQELAPIGARVNCVCPGTIDTEMTRGAIAALAEQRGEASGAVAARYAGDVPMGRFGTPEEVADTCVFLASPLARYVAGASLVVDGGELS